MKTNTNRSDVFQAIGLIFIMSICFLSYAHGLDSPFLFDDLPNMENIGKYAYLGNLNDFLLYILLGDSSPIGRPISLASFYINDNYWNGMSRLDFKYTNLMIHLINGFLVYWLTYKISLKLTDSKSLKWLALLTTTLWLLNPIHTNTVLYAVQRMTELAALFTLVSIIFYLYFTEYFLQKNILYILFLFFSFFSLLLGVLSKETALLTPIFILILEKTALNNNIKSVNLLLSIYLFLIITTLVYFGWFVNSSRDFTSNERLLSESRILVDYIKNIILPPIYGESLLYDDFKISKNLLEPITTLLSIIFIFLIIVFAKFKERKFPIISLGILLFFSGHLIESTTIQLELYFNHRNYLPSLGISLLISYIVLYIIQVKKNKKIAITFIFLYLGFLITSLNLIANLWANPEKMLISWLIDHPTSPRTIEAIYSTLDNQPKNIKIEKVKNDIDSILTDQYNYRYLTFKKLKFEIRLFKGYFYFNRFLPISKPHGLLLDMEYFPRYIPTIRFLLSIFCWL